MLEVTTASFTKDVLESQVPILADFWAPWCGPCRMVAPIVEELAAEYGAKIQVAKINVDDSPELAEKYQVMSIPTLCLFVKGQVAAQLIGFRPKKEIAMLIDQNL